MSPGARGVPDLTVLIKGGTVVDAGGSRRADVLVRDGIIAEVAGKDPRGAGGQRRDCAVDDL